MNLQFLVIFSYFSLFGAYVGHEDVAAENL